MAERYLKLKCLTYASEVIKHSRTICAARKVSRRIKGKEKVTLRWALTGRVKNRIIRVIIERVGTGKYKFLSVMPHNKRLITKKRRRRS